MQPPSSPQEPFQGYPRSTGPGYGSASVRFEAISEAWAYFQRDIGTWIASMLIVGFLIFLLAAGSFVGSNMLTHGEPLNMGGRFPEFPGFLYGLALQFAVGGLMTVLMAGLFKLAVKQVRGEPISVADAFGGFSNPFHLWVAGFLVNLGTTLGCCCFVLPGLLLLGLFMFVQPIVVDQRVGAIQAMTMSIDTLKPHLWNAMAFALVVSIILGVGVLACGIGALFAGPIYFLSISILYRDFFYQQVVPQPYTSYGNYPPPPTG